LQHAVGEYESEMLQYAFVAVANSKNGPFFRPRAGD
jgi:hypothetical protein